MHRPLYRYFSLAMVFLLLTSLYPWAAAARDPQMNHPTLFSPGRSLASFLRPDGTLDLPAGFSGSLDPAGYRLVSIPSEAPRFVPVDDGDEYWASGFGSQGMNGHVNALAVDAAGNLYAGGWFTAAGGVSVNNIAKWNGSNWSALSSGMNNWVEALVVDTEGNLYAGGAFTVAGGVNANRIARWNGSTWSALGSGMNSYVRALTVDAAGNVYAGGQFTTAGGVNAIRIARWNGSNWSALGSGMSGTPSPSVYDLEIDAAGNLYAGGSFSTAGGVSANYIAKWNGNSWSALGSGMGGGSSYTVVYALTVDAVGNLYAGGNFTMAGGISANNIARWDGSSWYALGSGTTGGAPYPYVFALTADAAGNLYAGGGFTMAGGVSANRIARWDGSNWSTLGSENGMNDSVGIIAVDAAGNLYAGGRFTTAGGVSANRIARWDGNNWSALGGGSGMSRYVHALVVDAAGNLYAGGEFVTAGDVIANNIARWNGSSWSALGSGMNDLVYALAVDAVGNLYAGGEFTTAGGVSAKYIAQWDGSHWSALGSGMVGAYPYVRALVVDATGNLYAGGEFNMAGAAYAYDIARWNGSSWSALGSGMGGDYSSVYALVLDAAGNLYAGGGFTTAGGVSANRIARWNGSSWSTLSTGMNQTVASLAMDAAGNLYAGGWFTTAGGVSANRIARWDGSNWSALGSGMGDVVYALAVDAANNLYAGGAFTMAGGVSANRIARWDGSNWSALGSGMDDVVYGLAVDAANNLYVGGGFITAGGKPSSYIAQWTGAVGAGRPSLLTSPNTVPADGTSFATITLTGAPAGHRVGFFSSRGSQDIFSPSTGTTNGVGRFSASLRSLNPGTAVITARDLTTGETFATSTQVTFTPLSGPPPSPPNSTDILITQVQGNCGRADCPKDGFFMLGLDGLSLPLRVRVDWRGNQPGVVEFSINGHTDTVPASSLGADYELNINERLREGANVLHITARSGDKSSSSAVLHLTGYRLPQWIMDGIHSLPNIGSQTLTLEIAFPGQPLCKRHQGLPHLPCEDFQWGFLSGDLNHFEWQTNIKLTLPTRGGAFEVQISRERDRAATGRKPKALLKLIGHETDIEYHGRLGGTLGPDVPYVIVQELELGASISREFEKDVGVVEGLNALPPFGTAAYAAISAVPPLYRWLNDRAKFYVKITPELSGHFTLAFQPGFHVSEAQLGLEFPLELGARADLWVVEGHIYGGLGGVGELGYDEDEISIISLRAYGYGGYLFRLAWFSLQDEGEWNLWEYPSGSVAGASSWFDETSLSANWRLIGHKSDVAYAVFEENPAESQAFVLLPKEMATPALGTLSTITSVLVSNVYTYTEPSLAVSPSDQALLLWVHDDINKPVGQSQEINFSRWDGTTWTNPAGVTNDFKLDSAPQVAWTSSNQAVAVWQRLNDTLPISATWSMTTANQIEIATATYDAAAGTWSPVTLLTTNTSLDMTPNLAANAAGNLLAVWRQNDDGLLSGDTSHPDRILAAFHLGAWITPTIAVDNIPGLVDLAAGYGTNAATIAYTQFLTPTGSITPTLQLSTSTWNGSTWSTPAQLTDDSLGHSDPQVVYNSTNQPLLVWLAGDELRLRNLNTGIEVTLTLPAEIGAIDEFRIVRDTTGNIAAVFTAQTAQRDLYVSLYDQSYNVWGLPVALSNDKTSEGYPAPALDATGRLLMGYAQTAMVPVTRTTTITSTGQVVTYTVPTEGQTDLVTLSHTFVRNLTLAEGDLTVSDDHPQPGSSVIISATVHNSGDLALDNVAVAFYDGQPGSGGTLIGSASWPQTLAAGYMATVTTTYTLPTLGGAHTLYAQADPNGLIAEADETDNTASQRAFGPDLELFDAGVDYWGGSQVGLVSLVRNIGTTASPPATVLVHRETLTGTVAISDTLPPLAAGQVYTLTTPWDYGSAVQGDHPLIAVVNQDESNFPEVFTDNNYTALTLTALPDLAVDPLYFWADFRPDHTLAITATVYNFGPLPASAVNVALYADDPLTATTQIASWLLPELLPASSQTVTTVINLAGQHDLYLWADPGAVITETVRTNNLASIAGCFSVPEDLDCSGQVNVLDVQTMALAWQTANPDLDFNGNGIVDIPDIQRVAGLWGEP